VKIKLKGAKVMRAGVTARYWAHGTSNVELQNANPGGGVENVFTLDSKGGGQTSISYVYSAQDYKTHLQMMVHNDRNAALAAMAEIMLEQIAHQSERETEAAELARAEIVNAAETRWREASGTSEAIAKIVHDGVCEIVEVIETPESTKDNKAA